MDGIMVGSTGRPFAFMPAQSTAAAFTDTRCGRRTVAWSAGLMSATDEAVPNILERPGSAGRFALAANMIAVKGRTDFARLKRRRFQLQLQDAALALDQTVSRFASLLFHCVFSAIAMKTAHFPGHNDPCIGAGRKRAEK
jgi:hypothetical protein